jgi:hypothetical protein
MCRRPTGFAPQKGLGNGVTNATECCIARVARWPGVLKRIPDAGSVVLVRFLCDRRARPIKLMYVDAAAILYGNIIMTAGSIIVAGAATGKSYQLMIFGRIVCALGDVATQIAAYRAFAAWFAPSAGFATTLGVEIGIGRIGGFLGSSTANIIAKVRPEVYPVRHSSEATVTITRAPSESRPTLIRASVEDHSSCVRMQMEAGLNLKRLFLPHISLYNRCLLRKMLISARTLVILPGLTG